MKRTVITGILTAMTVVVTVFTRIPFPLTQGYFNLGDAVILIAAVLFGGYTGAAVGAIGSTLADVITGSYIFAPVTLIVKGLAGYVTGRLCGKNHQERKSRRNVALLLGALLIVSGYFIAEVFLLSLYDPAFGLGAAVAELPVNIAQVLLSALLSRVIIGALWTVKK